MKNLIAAMALATALAAPMVGATHQPVDSLLFTAGQIYDASVSMAKVKRQMIVLRCTQETDFPNKDIVSFDNSIVFKFDRSNYIIQLAYLMSKVCYSHIAI